MCNWAALAVGLLTVTVTTTVARTRDGGTDMVMLVLAGVIVSALAAPAILLGSGVIVALRWRLNVLTLSADEAQAVGVDVRTLRLLLIICATVVTASVVSICGQVGWIGLIGPHAARMLAGSNNRHLIPVSLLLGASTMIIIDTVARTLTAAEIPVSVITAIVGAPFFITLMRRTVGVRA